MNVLFSRLAQQELEDAIDFYEMQLQGLGTRFRAEVKKAALRIKDYPEAWSLEKDGIRKCLLHTFPYKLLYSIEKDYIFIIAVAHLHRQPDYWIDR
jgi:plasmid stabilization system protein ParE